MRESFAFDSYALDSGQVLVRFRRLRGHQIEVFLTLEANYPIREPQISFRLTSSEYTTAFKQDENLSFSAVMKTSWKPMYSLSDVVTTAVEKFENSLYRNSRLVTRLVAFSLLANTCFLLTFLLLKQQKILHFFDEESNFPQSVPLIELLQNISRLVIPGGNFRTASPRRETAQNLISTILSPSVIFNVLYFVCLIVFVFFVTNEKFLLLMSRYKWLMMAFTLLNPLFIEFSLSNHVLNLGLCLFTISAFLLSSLELDLATVCFCVGQNFFPEFLGSYGCEFLVLLVLYGIREVPKDYLFPQAAILTRSFKFALRVFGIALTLFLVSKETSPETFARFASILLDKLVENMLWFPLTLLLISPQIFLILRREKAKETDMRSIWCQILLIHGIKSSKGNVLAAELALLLYLIEMITKKRCKNSLLYLFGCEIWMLWNSDRSLLMIAIAGCAQVFNFSFLVLKNRTGIPKQRESLPFVPSSKLYRVISKAIAITEPYEAVAFQWVGIFVIIWVFGAHVGVVIGISGFIIMDALKKVRNLLAQKKKIA